MAHMTVGQAPEPLRNVSRSQNNEEHGSGGLQQGQESRSLSPFPQSVSPITVSQQADSGRTVLRQVLQASDQRSLQSSNYLSGSSNSIQSIPLQQHQSESSSGYHSSISQNDMLHHSQLDSNHLDQRLRSAHDLQIESHGSHLDYADLSEYDMKSRDSKYRRWTPKMDQYLIKLLSDIVHSYPKGAELEMTKKAWAYLTGQLRAANPKTVYSTYTKYSCQQHLINVNHHRYKIWYVLMLHQKNNASSTGYSYRWSPEAGRFHIVDISKNALILDDRQVKALLYSDSLSLPSLTAFNKGNLIVNDFFLTDNLKYMSVYHNEILPLLSRLDPKYTEGLGDVYSEIHKFDFPEASNEYFKPLISAKQIKARSTSQTSTQTQHAGVADVSTSISDPTGNDISTLIGNKAEQLLEDHTNSDIPRKRPHSESNTSSPLIHRYNTDEEATDSTDESVDPALKKPNSGTPTTQSESAAVQIAAAQVASETTSASTIYYESTLASAAIAAINSPPVVNARDSIPFYVKDRKWFYKLISLNEQGLLEVDEVLALCEGIRDTKVPMFMLNVLDPDYYPSRNSGLAEPYTDEEIAKQIRKFILPMIYND